MMTKSRQGKKGLIGIFLAVLFLLAIFNGPVRNFFVGLGTAVFRPFLNFGGSIAELINDNSYILDSKESLSKENSELKSRLIEMEEKFFGYEMLQKENDELKAALSRPDKNSYIFAYVDSRPPQSPYDILIADMGEKDGVRNGMQVFAYDSILIGYVSEVFGNSSKIKLISFPGEETSAVLFSSNNQVIAAGKGGGNFEIKMPKSIEVNAGERVTTIGASPFLLGMIDKIEINPSDPFQKLYFRFPFNLQELKYIEIKK